MKSAREYADARNKYRPKNVSVLMIAESPPSSEGFFYFEKTIGNGDHLFRETMKAVRLWPEERVMHKDVDKRPYLKQFQSKGFFLIDTCELPVDKLDDRRRREAIGKGALRVVSVVKLLDPKKIVLVKDTVFEPVKNELEKAGFGGRILNGEPLPFPSHGWQRKYREGLSVLLG
jgi:hypothetical protein